MATLAVTHPTLLDVTNALDPNGGIAVVAEILKQTNEILEDMVWLEGNLPTGHRTSIRTGLPEPTWRRLYGGVQPTKSTRTTITDSCGMLEAYAEIDKALADLNGNTNAFRFQEDQAHIMGMSHTMASTLFFGDESVNPERFTGLSPRFDDITGPENAENIIDAGGTGTDNASIWLVGWGPNTVHGIYPKGSQAGLNVTDKGQVTLESAVDGAGGRMEAYRTHYRWDCGLCVRDWRYVVRIANIDRSLLTSDVTTGANLAELMFQATELVPELTSARFSFYMDRSVRTKFRQQMAFGVKDSSRTIDQVGGVRQMAFDGIPVRRVDAIRANEARIV
tara:strand:- start:23395 stop:24399 length:1005 start_codon:yes stop_codon:yes gene_type:complete